MDCARVRPLLSSYLDEQLGGREMEQVRNHLATCQACLQDLDSLQDTVALLRRLPELAVPRSFAVSAPVRPAFGWFSYLRAATLAAAALLMVVLAGTLLLPTTGAMGPALTAQPASAPKAPLVGAEAPAKAAVPTPRPEPLRAAPGAVAPREPVGTPVPAPVSEEKAPNAVKAGPPQVLAQQQLPPTGPDYLEAARWAAVGLAVLLAGLGAATWVVWRRQRAR